MTSVSAHDAQEHARSAGEPSASRALIRDCRTTCKGPIRGRQLSIEGEHDMCYDEGQSGSPSFDSAGDHDNTRMFRSLRMSMILISAAISMALLMGESNLPGHQPLFTCQARGFLYSRVFPPGFGKRSSSLTDARASAIEECSRRNPVGSQICHVTSCSVE